MFSEISSLGEETFETMSIGVSSQGKFSKAGFSDEHFSLNEFSVCMSNVLRIVAGVVDETSTEFSSTGLILLIGVDRFFADVVALLLVGL